MKKALLSVAMLATLVFGCKKDDDSSSTPLTPTPTPTPATQQAVGFYFSGNWCGPCGLYGKPALKSIKNEFKDKLVLVSCQLNGAGGATDPMNNADANALASVFQVTGVPTLYVGASDQQLAAISGGSSMESSIRSKVNSIVPLTPVAVVSGTKTISGSNITVKTNVEFKKDVTDQWNVAVFVLENSMLADQYVSGQGWQPNTDFSHILRMKLSAAVTGDDITTSGATKGKKYAKTFSGSLSSSWNAANLEVAVVLWKKVGNTVYMENGVIIK